MREQKSKLEGKWGKNDKMVDKNSTMPIVNIASQCSEHSN